jgi:hypothetical protein
MQLQSLGSSAAELRDAKGNVTQIWTENPEIRPESPLKNGEIAPA